MLKILAIMITALFPCVAFAAQDFDSIATTEQSFKQAKTENCKDDPRFTTELMKIANGDETAVLEITPESFIDLDDEIKNNLRGKVSVCGENPLLSNGRTLKPVQISFDYLWQKIADASKAGDFDKVKRYLSDYTSKPISTTKALNLLQTFNVPDMQTLYALIGRDVPVRPMPIDFFIFTGGRAENPENIVALFQTGRALESSRYKRRLYDKHYYSLKTNLDAKTPLAPVFDNRLKSIGLLIGFDKDAGYGRNNPYFRRFPD